MPNAACGSSADDADRYMGPLVVRVATLSQPGVIAATVTPLNLGTNDPEVTAIVGWEGINTLNSHVGAEADVEPWSRCLNLLWAVLGPHTAPEPDKFHSESWSSVVLSMQELDGALHHCVLVVLERDDWSAKLIRSDARRQGAELEIPVELRTLDAGSVLVEMTSRLIVGRPWL